MEKFQTMVKGWYERGKLMLRKWTSRNKSE